jgi:transcription initiation factor IIE alpha subunit
MFVHPRCPSCESKLGFKAAPFGDCFSVLYCASCGAVVGACESKAIAPLVRKLEKEIESLSGRISHLTTLVSRR